MGGRRSALARALSPTLWYGTPGGTLHVWDTHTRNCETCQQALRNLDRLRVAVFAAAALLLIVTIGLDGRGANIHAVWTLLAGAVLLGVGGLLLQKLRRLFFEYEFSHADND
jgi:hypothetical protein